MRHRIESCRLPPVQSAIARRVVLALILLAALFGVAATSKVLAVQVMSWRSGGEIERRVLIEGLASDVEQTDAVVAIQRRIRADLEALRAAEARGGSVAHKAKEARQWTSENSR